MNPEKENALNESLAMTKLTIDLLNQKKKRFLKVVDSNYHYDNCKFSGSRFIRLVSTTI